MLTIDQKKEILSKVENVLNTYNDGNFTQCSLGIDLNDEEYLACEKVELVRTLYDISYAFRGEDSGT